MPRRAGSGNRLPVAGLQLHRTFGAFCGHWLEEGFEDADEGFNSAPVSVEVSSNGPHAVFSHRSDQGSLKLWFGDAARELKTPEWERRTILKMSVILSMLLQGRLLRACRLAGAAGLAAVLVDPQEIKSKLALPRPGMSGELALIILGFDPSRGRRVFWHPEAAPLIPSEPYGEDVWVSPAALENFRQKYVTKKRLPLIMGARPLAIEKLLRERGVKPIWDPREFGAAIYEKADLSLV